MGNTKIFIRLPKTLFETEDAFQKRKNELISKLQAIYKGIRERRKYIATRNAIIRVQVAFPQSILLIYMNKSFIRIPTYNRLAFAASWPCVKQKGVAGQRRLSADSYEALWPATKPSTRPTRSSSPLSAIST